MNIEITADSINVKTIFDPAIIAKIKAVPDGRKWNPKLKVWRVAKTADNARSLEKSGIGGPELTELATRLDAPLRLNEEIWKRIHNEKGVAFLSHQKTGIGILYENDRAGLFWEQGVGKTLPMLMVIQQILMTRAAGGKSIIICPKGVIGSWAKQFAEFSNTVPTVIEGTAKKRSKILNGNHYVYLINYDLLSAMQDELRGAGFNQIIFDESQYIKNPESIRSEAAYEIANDIPRRYLLTGTPVGNGTLDIFQQYKVMDESIFGTSYFSFKYRYFANHGFQFLKKGDEKKGINRLSNKEIDEHKRAGWKLITTQDWRAKPGAIAEIKRKIALRGHRLTKKTALDLPPKIYQVIEVGMTAEQRAAYRQAERELKAIINDVEFNTKQAIVKMIRLNQICNGHIGSGDNTQVLPQNKIKELRRIFEDAGRQKIIVWTPHNHDVDAVLREFKSENAVSVRGGGNNTENIEKFQSEPEVRIIVCNESAGSTGVTLTASCLAVIMGRSYSLLNRMQLEDRNHRIGTDRPVTYIDLICRDSIESTILEVLQEKRKIAAELLGDSESSFTKDILRRLR